MSNNSVIEHRANYYFLMLHEEYLAICDGDHCQALILSVMEEWTNTKCKNGNSPFVHMAYVQWVKSLYGIYGRNTIINSIDKLVKAKILERRALKFNGKDTFEYKLNVEKVNELLKELPERSPNDTLPNLNAFKNKRVQNQTRLNSNGCVELEPVYFQTGDPFKNKPCIDTNTQITNNTDSLLSDDKNFSQNEQIPEDEKDKTQFPSFSYSKPTAPEETPISEKKPHTSRKPRPPKEPTKAKEEKSTPEEQARIDTVFSCLDKLAREATQEEEFAFSRTKAATSSIHDLISGRPVSEKHLHMVFMEMWNSPEGQNGFRWRDHMSIQAICRHYDNMLLAAMSRKSSPPAEKSQAPKYRPAPSIAEQNQILVGKW